MNKEAIKKIASLIKDCCPLMSEKNIYLIAKAFYEAGYRRIPDLPVLSDEERASILEYIEAMFPELHSSYWNSERWLEFKREQCHRPA